MRLLPTTFYMRYLALIVAVLGAAGFALWAWAEPGQVGPQLGFGLFAALAVVGVRDLTQSRHAILRNYPIIAHLRFIFEKIRPEMRQYFFEDDKDGLPFPRDKRAIVYQRAKGVLDKRPFGTQYDVYQARHEWLHHSVAPKEPTGEHFRISVGGEHCA